MSVKFEVVNPQPPRSVGISSASTDVTITGYCLWEFDGEKWSLKKDCCQAEHVPSEPPVAPGAFRGQIRSLQAVAAIAS